jgi:hypothetical protein
MPLLGPDAAAQPHNGKALLSGSGVPQRLSSWEGPVTIETLALTQIFCLTPVV